MKLNRNTPTFRDGIIFSAVKWDSLQDNYIQRGRKIDSHPLVSTVLEQDHFCSVFLGSHVTVLTNSQSRDDESTSHVKTVYYLYCSDQI